MSEPTRDAFAAHLAGLSAVVAAPPRPDRPANIEEAAAFYPETRRGDANKAIARQLGVSVRQVQRYRRAARGEAGEVRAIPTARLKPVLDTARRRQLAAWRKATQAGVRVDPLDTVAANGIDMRMRAWLIVSSPPSRVHTMPASEHVGPNTHARYQPVPGSELADALAAWREGDRDLAGELIDRAFLDAYGLPDIAGRHTELEDVEWTQIR